MPGLNGVEVCRQLRADASFNDVPIVMFTAKDQVDDKWAGFEAGADDYLTKPTDPQELDRRIQVLIRRASRTDDVVHELASMNIEESVTGEIKVQMEEEVDSQALMPMPPPSQLEEAEVASNLIAVVGVRGGVGTTTVAINLAASLADNAGQTCLVDLDFTQGHIAQYLHQKIQHESLNDMSRVTNTLELARRWQKYTLPAGNGLELLLSRPNLVGQWPVPAVNQIEVLIDALIQSAQYIVVDVGRGFLPAAMPILRRAKHVLVCTQPERVSLLAVKRFLTVLPTYMGQGAKQQVLMTTMGIDSALPQPAVEDFIHHELMATIPISSKEMAYAVNHNGPFVRLRPASKAAEIFREIVKRVEL
jgi:MinD-like ATPase involved in chromosome partitioning or flagellar assembly